MSEASGTAGLRDVGASVMVRQADSEEMNLGEERKAVGLKWGTSQSPSEVAKSQAVCRSVVTHGTGSLANTQRK